MAQQLGTNNQPQGNNPGFVKAEQKRGIPQKGEKKEPAGNPGIKQERPQDATKETPIRKTAEVVSGRPDARWGSSNDETFRYGRDEVSSNQKGETPRVAPSEPMEPVEPFEKSDRDGRRFRNIVPKSSPWVPPTYNKSHTGGQKVDGWELWAEWDGRSF